MPSSCRAATQSPGLKSRTAEPTDMMAPEMSSPKLGHEETGIRVPVAIFQSFELQDVAWTLMSCTESEKVPYEGLIWVTRFWKELTRW